MMDFTRAVHGPMLCFVLKINLGEKLIMGSDFGFVCSEYYVITARLARCHEGCAPDDP